MVRISSGGEILPDDAPTTSSSLPNAPLPSPPSVLHGRTMRHRATSGEGSSARKAAANDSATPLGSSGVQVIHRDSAFLGLPDVEILGTRLQGVHVLLVLCSFFMIGWRAIFVAVLVWALAAQQPKQSVSRQSSGGGPPRAQAFDHGMSGMGGKKLFTGKGHKLGTQ